MNFFIDTHCHTTASGHAYSSVYELIIAAKKVGITHIAITDHAPLMPFSTGSYHFFNLRALPKTYDGVTILRGAELNITDDKGTLDLPDELLKTLDINIASLHSPCIHPNTYKDYTKATISAIENPFVNIIGHLGDVNFPFDLEKVVIAAKENNVFLELNNSSLMPFSVRVGALPVMREIIKLCKELEHPVVLGSDTHFMDAVGNFSNIIPLLEEFNMPEHLILNTSEELFNKHMFIKKYKIKGEM